MAAGALAVLHLHAGDAAGVGNATVLQRRPGDEVAPIAGDPPVAGAEVVEAVKSGAIKRFVVMAGCDGRAKRRFYFTEVAEKLPKDTSILFAVLLGSTVLL